MDHQNPPRSNYQNPPHPGHPKRSPEDWYYQPHPPERRANPFASPPYHDSDYSGSSHSYREYGNRDYREYRASGTDPLLAVEPRFDPRYRLRSRPAWHWQYWLLGGSVLAALVLLLDPGRVFSSVVSANNQHCQEIIQPQSVLSREELSQLMIIPEREPKARVQDIVAEPYCLLPSLSIRSGVTAMREAYPLEFDPNTWLIILYEGDEYAGYRFSHH